MTTYNGWKNYETWNVALWIGNDEGLYRAAKEFMRTYEGRAPYLDFISEYGLYATQTKDGVFWGDDALSRSELNDMMREL